MIHTGVTETKKNPVISTILRVTFVIKSFWSLVVTPLSRYSVLRVCARETQIIVMIKLGITKQVAVLNHIQTSF